MASYYSNYPRWLMWRPAKPNDDCCYLRVLYYNYQPLLQTWLNQLAPRFIVWSETWGSEVYNNMFHINTCKWSEDGSTHNVQGQDGDIWTFIFDDFLRWSWERILLKTPYTHHNCVLNTKFAKQIFRSPPLHLPFLYVLCCTYVFLFMSLFCLKNKLCGFIQCLFRICRDVGNRKLIRFELRFSMRGIW